MNLWHDIPVGDDAPDAVNVIIECPKGTKNKYEIDKDTGLIKLDRAMKTAQDYPFDYGFVPRSLWDDDDALDVVVLSTYSLAPGILVEARPVAVMGMIDCGDGDDKIIAVPKDDPRWDRVKDLSDINPHTLKEIQHFFETYKVIEGKEVVVKKFRGRREALAAVKKGFRIYDKRYGKRK